MPNGLSQFHVTLFYILIFRKQLRDIFNSSVLHDTIMQILNMFMSMGRPHHWVEYLMPEDVRFYKSLESSGSNVSDITKLDQLMVETRTVLARYFFFLSSSYPLSTCLVQIMALDANVSCGEMCRHSFAKVPKWAGWVTGQNGQFISNSLDIFNEFNMIRKFYCCNICLKNKASYGVCIQNALLTTIDQFGPFFLALYSIHLRSTKPKVSHIWVAGSKLPPYWVNTICMCDILLPIMPVFWWCSMR